MEDTVVKQLFFSSRRYGRFSLHSVRCDACAIRLNIAFFHVFWFPTDGIPIRQGALFGRQIGSPKREHSKTFQNMRREKRTPNLSIPLSLVRRRLEFADDWSTRVGLSKNCAKFGKSFQIATKLCDFSHEKMNRSTVPGLGEKKTRKKNDFQQKLVRKKRKGPRKS